MKLAIIGSRGLSVQNLEDYISPETVELVSGGARGIDRCVADYAKKNNIGLIEFFPDYSRYGRCAPLKRNEEIAKYADGAIAFWDGRSKGTEYTIKQFKKLSKPITVVVIEKEN